MHLAYYRFSILLLAIRLSNAVNNNIDASKYTVAFDFAGLGYRCLGGIINDRFVISVGECFADNWAQYIKVTKITAIAGAKNLSNLESSTVKSEVEEVFLPWYYAGRTQRVIHDFAIVKLKDSLNLTHNGLIGLQIPTESHENDITFTRVGLVGGYGLNSSSNSNSSNPGELKYEMVKVVDYDDCFQGLAHDDYARNVQLCVKRKEGKCLSDRGSPYVNGNMLVGVQMKCNDDTTYELYKKVGAYSQLIHAALDDQPGLYSRHEYGKI